MEFDWTEGQASNSDGWRICPRNLDGIPAQIWFELGSRSLPLLEASGPLPTHRPSRFQSPRSYFILPIFRLAECARLLLA